MADREPPQYILNDENGTQVAFYSMLELAITSSSSIPIEPIEQGSFASYNRVIEPNEITALLALMGDDADIQDALNGLDELKKSETTLEFICPYDTYTNLMLQEYNYRRDGHSGQNVLQVEIKLREIRQVGTQKTTTAVDEPPPIEEEAAADGSVVSDEEYGEQQVYAPNGSETGAAETEAGQKKSILAGIFND